MSDWPTTVIGVERNALDRLPQFVRDHVLSLLGLIPFVLAAFQVVLISAGDPHVFGYIIQNLNVVTVFLTVTLPIIPVSIVLAGIYRLSSWMRTPKANRDEFVSIINLMWLAGIFIGVLMMPVMLVYFFGSVAVSLIVLSAIARRDNQRNALRFGEDEKRYHRSLFAIATGLSFFLLALLIVAASTVLMFSWTWLPTEIIDVKGQKPAAGQVLSSSGEWTTYLENSANRQAVHIIRTQDVVSRTPCKVRDTDQYNSVGNFIFRRGKSGPQDDCPKQ